MYAVTENGYRAVKGAADLIPGESLVTSLPTSLVQDIRELEVRADRDNALRATDWTQMADAPLGPAQRSSWALYRQALRDMPSSPQFPDVPWPVPPELDGAAGDIKAPM